MTTIPNPRDVTEILRGVGSAEFPWKDPTLGTLLHRAADEIEQLREIAEAADQYHDVACNPDWCRLCRAISAWKEARRG